MQGQSGAISDTRLPAVDSLKGSWDFSGPGPYLETTGSVEVGI